MISAAQERPYLSEGTVRLLVNHVHRELTRFGDLGSSLSAYEFLRGDSEVLADNLYDERWFRCEGGPLVYGVESFLGKGDSWGLARHFRVRKDSIECSFQLPDTVPAVVCDGF